MTQQIRPFRGIFNFYIPKSIPKILGCKCLRLPPVEAVGRPCFRPSSNLVVQTCALQNRHTATPTPPPAGNTADQHGSGINHCSSQTSEISGELCLTFDRGCALTTIPGEVRRKLRSDGLSEREGYLASGLFHEVDRTVERSLAVVQGYERTSGVHLHDGVPQPT